VIFIPINLQRIRRNFTLLKRLYL